MSTYDTPGHNPKNWDRLAMGCWAEHQDGSLVHVHAVEGGRVVYSIFDLGDEPLEYRHAMPEDGFKQQFSWPNSTGIQWTWHDKTPFPWERVMSKLPPGQKHPSAMQQLSAAARVAQHLGAQARKLDFSRVPSTARRMMKQISDAIRSMDLGG